MEKSDLIAGWRGLSVTVSSRLGQPIGVGRVRWVVESSGLPIGRRAGNTLVFDAGDVDATVRLLEGRRSR